MKIKSLIYKILLSTYKVLPCKRLICHAIKRLKIPNEKFYRDLRFGGKFKVEFDDEEIFLYNHGGGLENEIFWNGLKNWEKDTIWLWMKLTKESNVILDIGANTGVYSLLSKSINPASEIHAFEPSVHIYNKLVKNVAINEMDINTHDLAISNFTGEQTFYDFKSKNPTSASLSSEMMKNKSDIIEYKVKTTTLDDFISLNGIKKIDLIKVDIEMHEPEFVEGFKQITNLRPIIFIEILSDDVANQLNKLLKDTNMLFFELNFNSLKRIPILKKGKPYYWNFLIVPSEKLNSINLYVSN